MLLKLDIAKAFDSVHWDFIDRVLMLMGFPEKWRSWIYTILSTSHASVLVNGSPS